MSVIKFENVCFGYTEKINVINNLNLDIEEGQFVAVVGANGSGKSTVAKLINALITPASGSVSVFGIDTNDKNGWFEIRKKVGMVFQNPDNQMVASIVEDDIAFGPENLGVPREEIGKRIQFALKTTGTEQFRKRASSNLSGGQKQRVAIAGVLALLPRIIILDEATSMLDPLGRREVMETVKKLNKEQGITVICVTHYMEEAAEADKIIVLKEGNVAFSGTPLQVFSREKDLEKCGLCLPRPTYIYNRLKEQCALENKVILAKEELADTLCELLSKT